MLIAAARQAGQAGRAGQTGSPGGKKMHSSIKRLIDLLLRKEAVVRDFVADDIISTSPAPRTFT